MTIETAGSGTESPKSASDSDPADAPTTTANTDSSLEQAYAALVAAINAQPAGGEARYLARLALLLLAQLQFSDAALRLIELAREKPESEATATQP